MEGGGHCPLTLVQQVEFLVRSAAPLGKRYAFKVLSWLDVRMVNWYIQYVYFYTILRSGTAFKFDSIVYLKIKKKSTDLRRI